MNSIIRIITILILVPTIAHAELKKYELRMSMDDVFIVSESSKWDVEVKKQLMLRFANVHIFPKKNKSFDLMLFFKCDTPDLAQFDSPQKIAQSIFNSSQKYLPHIVEKEIKLNKMDLKNRYGYYTILTDAKLIDKQSLAPEEFKYMIRGMVRLSDDSALGFSIMINDLESQLREDLFKYILSFVK